MKILNKIELKNGIFIFLGISTYFLIIDFLGLTDNPFLKLFNIVFVIWGLNRTIRKKLKDGEVSFLANFSSILLTAFYGVALSVSGLAVYLLIFPPAQGVESLADSVLLAASSETHTFQYCLALFVEGFTSSAAGAAPACE